MNIKLIEAHELIAKARESLRRGDKASARQMGERAARLAPGVEDTWLILAASDPNLGNALAYAQKALQINPHSSRAQRAVEWTSALLKQTETVPPPVSPVPSQVGAASSLPKKQMHQTAIAMPALKTRRSNWLPILLIGTGILFIGFLALFLVLSPTLISMVNSVVIPARPQENLWAPMDIVKPDVSPVGASAFAIQP